MKRHALWALWSRLVTFAGVMALLLCSISSLVEIDGWRAYETGSEIVREIGSRLILAIGCAVILGTVATIAVLPVLLAAPAKLQARSQKIVELAGTVVALSFAVALIGLLIRWSSQTGLLDMTHRGSIALWLGLSGLLVAGYLLRQFTRPSSNANAHFVETFSGKMSRRIVLLSGIAGLLTAFRATGASRPPRVTRSRRPASGPNVVLVTFDALSAEDMSCYGYHLQTTPNIDALARNSYLFSNYYAVSTFTTPNVVSMLTGRYPSSTRVYHYGGKLHGIEAERTLPRELSKAGYRTLASVANPGAHPDCLGFGTDFDSLPPPPITDFATRETTAAFHSAQLAYDAGLAARVVPYTLEQLSPRLFGQRRSSTPPALSFEQAAGLLDKIKTEEPYFLWVHTYAPHFPYLPDPPYLHRFLASDELRTHAEFANMVDLKGYSYSPSRQPLVDKARLRYNEWVAQADGEFGRFMAMLRASGRLQNTAVIVSADHGECFAGGYLGHGGSEQRRPILHVPLLIHLPQQTTGAVITETVDQTALAPTILELTAGARAPWMDGSSLGALLGRGGPAPEAAATQPALAFAQVLESDSVFRPVNQGTLGVIDGRSQYVWSLDNGRGALYALAESDQQKLNRSSLEPELAARLRGEIARRFPTLLGEKA